MSRITITRMIDAPIEKVFKTVSDINEFSQAITHVVNVEFLSEVHSGVGTRFRETRLMQGKEASTELEVTEFVENKKVRIVSDTHGTFWDTVFSVEPKEGQTELTMTMDATAKKIATKMMIPMIMSAVKKAIEKDIDSVKAFCEKGERRV